VKKKKVFCKMLEDIQTHPKQQIQNYKCTRKKGQFKLPSIEEVSTTRRKTLIPCTLQIFRVEKRNKKIFGKMLEDMQTHPRLKVHQKGKTSQTAEH
jgi:hypothetical protein